MSCKYNRDFEEKSLIFIMILSFIISFYWITKNIVEFLW